jgi:hypothetical protein
MGTVKFLDDSPFDLELAKPGTAGPVANVVWAVLPVFSLGPQRQVREIHLSMSIGHARHLAKELNKAAGLADMHDRGTSR